MAKEKAPAYQHYPKDILSDINYQMMTWAERGMYRHLIDICWLEQSIPNDPAMICRILQIPDEKTFEQGTWPLLARCFKQNEQYPSQLVHPRLDNERQKQADHRSKSAEGGRHSAHKRKHQKQITSQQGTCDLVATKVQPKVNSSSSSSSSFASSNKKREQRSRRMPKEFVISDQLREWGCAERPDLDIDKEIEALRDYEFRDPHTDWNAVFRNWIRRAKRSNNHHEQKDLLI